VPRQTDARRRIIDYLAANGPVEDASGRATSLLKDAVGYEGTHTGFIQLVAAMAKSGDVHRDVRGKRTYRLWVPVQSGSLHHAPSDTDTDTDTDTGADGIGVGVPGPTRSPAAAPGGGPPSPAVRPVTVGELDYDELAATLLSRVTKLVARDNQTTSDTSWARRRLERLETQNAKLERELARLRGEAEMNRQERDALRTQLDAAQHNLELLTERMGSTPAPRETAANRLDADERALLQHLGGDRPGDRGHSARVS
jgi:hypothetical protein